MRMDDQVKLIFIVGTSREVKKDGILALYIYIYVILNDVPFALFVCKFSYVLVLNKNYSTLTRLVLFVYIYY